jgi:hypothetical protein
LINAEANPNPENCDIAELTAESKNLPKKPSKKGLPLVLSFLSRFCHAAIILPSSTRTNNNFLTVSNADLGSGLVSNCTTRKTLAFGLYSCYKVSLERPNDRPASPPEPAKRQAYNGGDPRADLPTATGFSQFLANSKFARAKPCRAKSL